MLLMKIVKIFLKGIITFLSSKFETVGLADWCIVCGDLNLPFKGSCPAGCYTSLWVHEVSWGRKNTEHSPNRLIMWFLINRYWRTQISSQRILNLFYQDEIWFSHDNTGCKLYQFLTEVNTSGMKFKYNKYKSNKRPWQKSAFLHRC